MSQDWFVVSQDGSAQVLALAVPMHVDSSDFDRLHELILSAVSPKASGQWVIDLTGLSYMGSSVLGLMVNIRQRIRQNGGKLVLCGMNSKLHAVFRTCSLERLFVIKATRDEALETILK